MKLANKRTLAKVTAVAMAASMLAACGSSGSSTAASGEATGEAASTDSSAASGGATVVEVWSNNRHDETYMTQMIDEFNASHDDIQIEYTIMTDDWANSIQLAFQANTAPDIITIAASDNMFLSDYVNGGMFESLSPWIDADTDFQTVTEVYDHMYEGLNSIGDQIYWVPNGVRSGTRIEYNVDLLSAAGYDSVPNTLDGLVEAAAAVTANGGGTTYGVGFTSSSPLSRWLEGVATMSGATYRGYDYTTGTYDFSSWKPVIESAAKFYTDGSVLPGSETQGVDNSRALFAQGAFAIWGNASQEAGVFTDQFPIESFEWGVAELPTVTGEVTGALEMTPNFGFAMLTNSDCKDQAWEVIKYFSSEDFMKGYLEGGYTLPISNYMSERIDSSLTGRLADFALQDYEDVFPTPPTVTVDGDDYGQTLWNAVLGNVSVDEAIEDLNTRYNDALERALEAGSTQRVIIEDYDPAHPSAGTVTYSAE